MTTSLPASREILRAVLFAAERHGDQRRKDSARTPYINHPVEVAELLVRVGEVSDVTTLQAALLHDTVEDTETTLEELESEFGPAVRDVVAELTDDKSLPRLERKRLQIERTPSLSFEARTVKLGDLISNVGDITPTCPERWSDDRRHQYIDWAEQVAAGCQGVNPPLERLLQDVARARREALPARA